MRRYSGSLCLLLVLQGCAYQQIMKHGETAAAAQEWDRAYDAYRFANELKPGKAEAAMAEARTAAAGAELAAAEAAVAAKDFAQAEEHLDRAQERDPQHVRLEEVRKAARSAMAAEMARRMASDDPLRSTYEFAVLAKRLYPTVPQVEDAIATLRDRIEDEAHALLERRAYAEARAMARTMAEVEPEQTTRGAILDREVTDTWVAALVDEAEGARRERPALAAVYYARAFEVGRSEKHWSASRSALEAAAPAAGLPVFVDSKGDGGGHYRLRKALRATLEDSPGVKAGWSSGWDLQATLYTNGERCKETKAVVPLTKDYVSGLKQVPNPAHVEVAAALAKATKDRDAAKIALAKAQKTLAPVSAQAQALQKVRDDEQSGYDAAVARQAETERQYKTAQDRQAHLTTMASGGDPAMVATAKTQEGVVAEWATKLAEEQEAVAGAKKRLDAATVKLTPVKAEADRQAAAAQEIEARRAAADTSVVELTAKERATAETLAEEVHALYKYNETTWTLTCDATATVYFGTRWKSDLAKKQTFQAKTSTTDLSRPGHVGAQVAEDPKAYPRLQSDMVVELDATAHKGIAAAIEAFVDESFDRKLEAALASPNTKQATDTLMTLYAGAPQRLDNAVRARLVEHLKAHYGIEDPAVLGVELLKEEPKPAPEGVAATAPAAVEAVATDGSAGSQAD